MMALEFLGGDPESDDGGSPTVWRDPATGDYILRGWEVAEASMLTETGDNPPGETLIRFPARMMQFFPEVNRGGADLR
ncbi:hypothetical protein ACFVH6_13200 [Spirillospora sp. NPDC127200]